MQCVSILGYELPSTSMIAARILSMESVLYGSYLELLLRIHARSIDGSSYG